MASHPYYGFTHAGTQYAGQYTPSTGPVPGANQAGYGAAQGGYVGQRAAGYDHSAGYGAAPYSYPPRPQTSNTVCYPAVDTSQYQDGSASGYGYGTDPNAAYTNSYSSVVTNYAASTLYSAASQNAQPPPMSQQPKMMPPKRMFNRPQGMKGPRPAKSTVKGVQQLHYCEVCKISCAGPQTYKEHLEGQKHKKKDAAQKAAAAGQPPVAAKRPGQSPGLTLRCELCDVSCTGADAYAAHVRGSKHAKVVKLHQKLGKPIPPAEPTVFAPSGKQLPSQSVKIPEPLPAGKIKVVGTPRINFLTGGRLHTTNTGGEDGAEKDGANDGSNEQLGENNEGMDGEAQSLENQLLELERSDIQPIGHEFVEETKNEQTGKTTSFFCKLCECRFNDPNAKEMHLKGRRHRLQYKKKVDPNYIVDTKPVGKQRKQLEKDRRGKNKNAYWGEYQAGYWAPPPGYMGPMGGPMYPPFRRTPMNSWDDTHLLQKHANICPKEEELDEIHHVVTCVERALKKVSDKLAAEDAESAMDVKIQQELGDLFSQDANSASTNQNSAEAEVKKEESQNGDDANDASADVQVNQNSNEPNQRFRCLKGLMRVGSLAKGLLLSGDKAVDLVVICTEKPTKKLLQRVVDGLPPQLQEVSPEESFEIVMKAHEGGLSVSSVAEPRITVNITLTSSAWREESEQQSGIVTGEMVKELNELLDKDKCLDALAALRHAKWFQARVAILPPCSMIIRILKDLCRRLPTWGKLSLWSIQLLCEKVISSAGEPLSPGEAFRHIFEALASGLILPGGHGLLDPCEKTPSNALTGLSKQDLEDITVSAQHCLRLLAFRQIHKVLGIDQVQMRGRKKKLENENGEASEGDAEKTKKKMKTETEEQEAENGNPVNQSSSEATNMESSTN